LPYTRILSRFLSRPSHQVKEKNHPLLLDAYMDVVTKAPTVGALGDARTIAESAGVRRTK
jgi:hypothetical protein